VTEFFYWSINDDPTKAIANLALLFFTMLGLIVVAGLIGRRYYYESWLAVTDAQTMMGPARRTLRLRMLEFGRRSFLPPQADAILKRDAWLFLREPSQWLHLLLMLVLLCIFLISMNSLQLRLSNPLLQAVSFLVVFLFNGFLIASIALRFVFPSVSLEGETFWAVRTSPLSLKSLYVHKFSFSFLTLLILAELLSVISVGMLRRDPSLMKLAAFCTGWIALGLTSLNLGAGTYFAAFKEKNPIRVASSQGASITFLVSMVYLSVVVGIMVVPLNRYFERSLLFGVGSSSWIVLPVVSVGILSVLLFMVSSSIGLKSIQRDY
jgi:ABC-2 type transport system permease protein